MNLYKQYVEQSEELIITTDLETDDLVAIKKLAEHIKDKKVMFIVGEGNAIVKCYRMNVYAKKLGFTNFRVIQGYGSDKDFKYDGRDVFNEEFCQEIRQEKSVDCLDVIEQEIRSQKNPIIIMFKPPGEFIDLYKKDIKIFENTALIGYFAFNIRCLLKEHSREDIISFIDSFKNIVFYETFLATGENNTIDFEQIDFNKLDKFINRLMELWNTDIREYCEKELQKTLDIHAIKRNKKIIDSIDRCKGKQFVNADSGLAITMFLELDESEYYYGSVSIDQNGYSVPKREKEGKILIVNPVDKEKLRQRHLEVYKNF